MDIGERIIFLRTAKQYSVNKLANLAGISQSYLRDIELGNKNPTVEILSYICDALDLSLSDFFNDNKLDSIATDPLTEKLYRLTPKQKNALMDFLDSMLS
ncbi:MAG: helix-turn-helix domain-containing protein [Lachnospiraceae bacterium]|nr:helix-turn-helix domain-containing protein [Lachnospiraceae bacterium]